MKSIIAGTIARGVLVVSMMAVAQGAIAQDNGDLDRITSDKVVRAGAIEAYPYYHHDLSTGEWVGMMPEILTTLFDSIGVEVEFVETTWGTAAAGLQSDKFDIVGGFNATPPRALAADFSNTVAQSRLAVYTLGNDSSAYANWTDLNTPDVRVAAVDGASTTRLAQSIIPDANWTLVKGTDAMVLELESGRVDVILSNEPTLSQYMQTKQSGAMVTPAPVRAQNVNIGMRSGSDELKQWLDVAVDYYTATGAIPSIWTKYVPTE